LIKAQLVETYQRKKFFTSDFEYHKEHSLEDCICRPLIGRQDHHPFLYFLKDDPDVVNIYLESIEHHIRYKDPERHKAKLLEMIGEKHMNKDENKNGQDITIRT
jgi:hypothetical protein